MRCCTNDGQDTWQQDFGKGQMEKENAEVYGHYLKMEVRHIAEKLKER